MTHSALDSLSRRLRRRERGILREDPLVYQGQPVAYAHRYLRLDPGLWEAQERIAESIHTPPYKTLVRAAHSVGKCVQADELITLADGSRVRASDLVGRSFRVLTLRDGRVVQADARADWNTVEPIYRLTTETGLRIIRNAHHPLWTADAKIGAGIQSKVSGGRWKGAAEFSSGDLVAVADELPAGGQQTLTDVEVKLLAYLIGDGGMTGSTLVFSQSPNAQLAEFRECCTAYGVALNQVKGDPLCYRLVAAPDRPKVHVIDRNGRPNLHKDNPLRTLLGNLGILGRHSRQQRVPAPIFSSPLVQQAIFLNRLYSMDGWASLRKPSGFEIGYCSTSETLCRDVQHLLLRQGIHASIRYRPSVDAWTTDIHGIQDARRFDERIGIYGKEPALAAIMERCIDAKKERKWRRQNAAVGTRWERVRSIEELPASATVAIEVPDGHTYLTEFWEHNSFLAACLINYWYDCYPESSAVITTAPTSRDVRDVLWREVRLLRARVGLGGFAGPKTPELWDTPDHYAKGFTAERGELFVGRHLRHMLFIFDEACLIDAAYWTTTASMFQPDGRHAWLVIGNPTDTSSQMYAEEIGGGWNVIEMSALDHPNIQAELRGEAPPYPTAVTLSQFREWLRDWATPVGPQDKLETDLAFPPTRACPVCREGIRLGAD